jgi:hypothetical protein
MADNIDDAITELTKQYDEVLQACYDALAEGVSQEQRNAIRKSIVEHLGK